MLASDFNDTTLASCQLFVLARLSGFTLGIALAESTGGETHRRTLPETEKLVTG